MVQPVPLYWYCLTAVKLSPSKQVTVHVFRANGIEFPVLWIDTYAASILQGAKEEQIMQKEW